MTLYDTTTHSQPGYKHTLVQCYSTPVLRQNGVMPLRQVMFSINCHPPRKDIRFFQGFDNLVVQKPLKLWNTITSRCEVCRANQLRCGSDMLAQHSWAQAYFLVRSIVWHWHKLLLHPFNTMHEVLHVCHLVWNMLCIVRVACVQSSTWIMSVYIIESDCSFIKQPYNIFDMFWQRRMLYCVAYQVKELLSLCVHW